MYSSLKSAELNQQVNISFLTKQSTYLFLPFLAFLQLTGCFVTVSNMTVRDMKQKNCKNSNLKQKLQISIIQKGKLNRIYKSYEYDSLSGTKLLFYSVCFSCWLVCGWYAGSELIWSHKQRLRIYLATNQLFLKQHQQKEHQSCPWFNDGQLDTGGL